MFSPNFFIYLLLIALFFCSSCGFRQNSNNSNTASNQNSIAEIESEIPFPTKEPETFQAEVITKFESETEKNFIAQSRGRFFSRKGDLAVLQTDINKTFLLNYAKKTYVENSEKIAPAKETSGETLNDFLTTEWLNQKADTKFESLGEENGLSKYRALFENSEALIYVDQNLKFPIRQEYYSIEGETKTLLYSTEIQNYKLIVEETYFEIPKDFRKISLDEFRKNE